MQNGEKYAGGLALNFFDSAVEHITFVAIKAKIHDIRHTLHLRHKYDHAQKDLLQSELQQAHQDYMVGKPG